MKSFTPFLDMKLGKTKILVLWNALNDEKSHNNSQQCLLYYKTWCGGVCVVEILLEVVKKIGFEAFFLLQNVQIFMNLFMISVAKKFRKMGFRVNHLITRILFFCKSFLIIKTCRVLHRECHLFSWYLESYFGKWISAKISEAILNKIKVCGTFIIKFHIEIHLLKDDLRYHENKWHSLSLTLLHIQSFWISYVLWK